MKYLSLLQPAKASVPIDTTELGISTTSRAEHNVKASLPIVVTEEGIVIPVSSLHS